MWEIRALRPGQLHQTLEIQLPTTEVLMEIELIMREVRTSFPREPPRAEPRFFCLPCRDSLSFPLPREQTLRSASASCVSCFSFSLILFFSVEKLNKNNDITVRRGRR